MKYKLININTKEEHLCDKVTIDGFDYYVSDEKPTKENQAYIRTDTGLLFNSSKGSNPHIISKYCRLIIATNNPNIDLPQVVDEVENLAIMASNKIIIDRNGNPDKTLVSHYKEGYNKSQETHPFSEEDTLDFLQFYKDTSRLDFNSTGEHHGKSPKEILEIWKSKKPKIVYYE